MQNVLLLHADDARGELESHVHCRIAVHRLTVENVPQGAATMQTNKDRQVQPTLKAKGIPGLLATMEGAVNQVKKAAGR
jgi:hypothetical protein